MAIKFTKPSTRFKGTVEQEAIWKEMRRGTGPLMVNALAGSGKCLAKGTPVLLHDGSTLPVESIRRGDLLMGPDSSCRQVLAVSSGRGMLYEIVPIKGDSWTCNEDHILVLEGTNGDRGNTWEVSVKDYLKALQGLKGHRVAKNWKLVRVGVAFPLQQSLPFPPYLIGLWLGDGTRGSANITNANPIIQSYCLEVGKQLGCVVTITPDARIEKHTACIAFTVKGRTDRGFGRKCHPLRDYLIHQCMSHSGHKTIPLEYRRGTWNQRAELLAGILDTDADDTGCCSTIVVTTGENYRDDLLFLARSLGLAAYCVSSKTHTCRSGRISTYYKISISGDLNKIPTKVKKFPPKAQIKRHLVTGFIVRKVGVGTYFGFTLSGDGRFLLGDFTVTHNTFTMVEGYARDKGAFGLLRGMTTFGRAAGDELKAKAPAGVVAGTIHGFMYRVLLQNGFDGVGYNGRRLKNLTDELFPYEKVRWRRGEQQQLRKLAGLCKDYGIDREALEDATRCRALMEELSIQYGFEVTPRVYGMAQELLLKCLEPDCIRETGVDFGDMIWLPYVFQMKPRKLFDVLVVDECQDCSCLQHANILSLAKRLIVVGDENQACYAFRGASPDSMNQLRELLGAPVELPLSVSWRCCREVIRLAQGIVPGIRWAPGAVEGEVMEQGLDEDWTRDLQPGHLILCRTNAPLVVQLFDLWGMGKRAFISGRQMGDDLKDIVNEEVTEGDSIGTLSRKLEERQFRDEARVRAGRTVEESEKLVDRLRDQYECLREIIRQSETVADVKAKLGFIFQDVDDGQKIRLSTIHRAKGSEAEEVTIIEPQLLPHYLATLPWEFVQERNLAYIGATRAKKRLRFIGNIPPIFQFSGTIVGERSDGPTT